MHRNGFNLLCHAANDEALLYPELCGEAGVQQTDGWHMK